jgi:hypothetical protein
LQDIFVKQGAGLFKTCDSTFVWTQEQLLGYYRLTYGDFGEMNQ